MGGVWRRVAAVVGGIVLAAATLVGCGSGAAGRVVLVFYTSPDGVDQYRAAAAECSRASGGRYTIEQRRQPTHSTDDQRLYLARRLATSDTGLDIMALDDIWTAEFAQAGWILPYPPEVARQVAQGTLRVPLETGMYQGRLYAAPLTTNTQLLWYRKDLVPHPPKTWDEMIRMAEDLARRGLPHYIEVQGARYEGLAVWFNTLLASGGGAIVAENGDVQVARGDAARQAVGVMARVATSRAADPSLSLSHEDETRLAMQAGKAAFEVNYPFVYVSMHEDGGGAFIDPQGRPTSHDTGRQVGDVFGWAPYPSVVAGTPARVTIGGLNLGVSATSRHPAEAFEAVQCLRNRDNQLRQAVGVERPPTLAALYDDPTLRKRYPAWQEIRDSLDHGSVRPRTPAYANISIVISDLLNPPSKINPNTVVDQLADQIAKAVTSQGLVP
ncbi:MAG: ABC transporter substrate-binding protein [Pseudonocardiales bacterium]|nr:ABC transporter substrate-binding protein [Pseudonocardiales bacterium]MBV9728917.1 ABC transporter substrate-binding protein [Pseudonocardiales bacterium]